jgi:hypothetical protein
LSFQNKLAWNETRLRAVGSAAAGFVVTIGVGDFQFNLEPN